jgi:glycosyltransferase involved in cell wall biosynthesis
MIYFDVTKSGGSGHRSGLMRVNLRLRQELGTEAEEISWPRVPRDLGPTDWFLTAEIFSPAERPGFGTFLRARPCRFAAIFHDAIPLRYPEITWPQSVARHPSYVKMLAQFDLVWAVSATSRRDLVELWRWQGVEKTPPVEVIALGADFNAAPRMTIASSPSGPGPNLPAQGPRFLCVGILEPRKNQLFLLEVAAELWSEGLDFELHLVGRVNPHFGLPVVKRIKALQGRFRGLFFHAEATDQKLSELYAGAWATLFPTMAEGCGLPLLESLWMGVPCGCSDLRVLRENADGGGCLPLALNDRAAWKDGLRQMLTTEPLLRRLRDEAQLRELPTWAEAARAVRDGLR